MKQFAFRYVLSGLTGGQSSASTVGNFILDNNFAFELKTITFSAVLLRAGAPVALADGVVNLTTIVGEQFIDQQLLTRPLPPNWVTAATDGFYRFPFMAVEQVFCDGLFIQQNNAIIVSAQAFGFSAMIGDELEFNIMLGYE